MNKLGIVVAGGLLSLGAFAADDGLILGGYVDAGYQAVMQNKVDGNTVFDTNGFLVREGGVYLGKKWGSEWEVFSNVAYNHNNVATGFGNAAFIHAAALNASNAGTIYLKQAFVQQTMDNGFWWKLGKFDGIFGPYAGKHDSWAHNLTNTGYIQGAYLPDYHIGWQGGYSFSDMLKVSVLVANDNEDFGPNGGTNGPAGTGTTFGQNSGTRHPDFGALISADFDMINANIGGYIMTGQDDQNGIGNSGKNQMGYVITADVGTKWHDLTASLYGVTFKNDVNNDVSQNSADFGGGLNVGYNLMNDKLGLNVRGEYVSMKDKTSLYDIASGTWVSMNGATSNITQIKSVLSGTFGAQWKFNDNVKAKVDYTYTKAAADGGTIDPQHLVNAGVVVNF